MTQADDFTERFNGLEYGRNNALTVVRYYVDLDKHSSFSPDEGTPDYSAFAGVQNPAFPIFIAPHLEGTYTFEDGSQMRIERTPGTTERQARAL